MAPAEDHSNLRVFVHWHDQTIFAGEEVKCTITFKNVASDTDAQKSHQQPQTDRHRLASTLNHRAKLGANPPPPPPPSASTGRGHRRSALSVNIPSGSHGRSGSIQWPTGGDTDSRSGHAHKRSVSIVSIGSSSTIDGHPPRSDNPPPSSRPQRPGRGHGRSASLQILPRRQLSPPAGPKSATPFARQTSSPLLSAAASYPPDSRSSMRNAHSSRSPMDERAPPRRSPRASPNAMPEFRFPAAPPPPPADDVPRSTGKPHDEGLLSPTSGMPDHNGIPSRTKNQAASAEKPLPAARILSSTSAAEGTPRSSGELYSMSNHSSETLASEYIGQPSRAPSSASRPRRRTSMAPQRSLGPESLMMGFVQIQGSFTLDGSLVDLGPFEQVKKRAVVGGRGGGVVGLEPSGQRDRGLFKGLGWSNISTSLGDLLGGGELSTIREMRGVANSKSVPLLSTTQSILFVDLRLAPGESRTFEYVSRLPRGLPPSHKGKAMKISYSLVIGTQRAGGPREQQVRSVEAPFRVLGGVNSTGEILGHDLMNPYILLRDEATVTSGSKRAQTHKSKAPSRAPATLNEFLNYVDELVARPRDESGGQLLSPSATGPGSRRASAADEGTTSKDAIHFAIMRSNMTAEGQQSPNRFDIARNGMRVGVVMLTRPSYRLGEVVTMAIDLAVTDIPCYAIHMTLETCEKIDPSLAVRSESSIQRVTRKVYATSSDTTLYSRRVVFTPTIPIAATPEFFTSGVSLEWKIRVEFVVPSHREKNGAESAEDELDPESSSAPPSHPLLEQISQDEKGGLVLAAAENLACESFDVMVPLRVYGAVGSGLERLESDEASDEGLVV